MEYVAYALLSCLVLIGLDWALIDGFRASLVGFRKLPEGCRYRHFIFPRIGMVIIAGVVMYVSSQTKLFGEMSDVAGIGAMAAFVLLVIYPQVVMFRRSEPYRNE
jgi:hypothetical protein